MGVIQYIFGKQLQRATDRLVAEHLQKRADAGIHKWATDNLWNPGSLAINEDLALSLTAVNACVRILQTSISGLPKSIRKRLPDDKGTEPVRGHPVSKLLRLKVNPSLGSIQWFEYMMKEVLIWGNGYSLIVRDGAHNPIALLPIPQKDVKVLLTKDQKLIYVIGPSGKSKNFAGDDVFHLKGMTKDGYIGISPITAHAEDFALAQFALRYGVDFYAKSATPKGLLMFAGDLTPERKEDIGKQWLAMYGPQGKTTAVLDEGWSYKQLSIAPSDAQYLGGRKMQKTEIATIYGLPAHMVNEMERATFNNIEHTSIEYVKYSLLPWVIRFEQEVNIKLLREDEQEDHFCKLNVKGLMRGDSKSQGEFFQRMLQMGVYSINEVRAFDDLNPIEGGDEHRVPMNTEDILEIKEDDNTSKNS